MEKRIKEVRKHLKMTQEEFADVLCISRNYVTLLETGNKPITDKIVWQICTKYDISEEWLRRGKGNMLKPLSRPEEIARITNELLKDDDPFKLKLAEIVSKMDKEQISILKKYAVELAKTVKEE